MGKTQPKDRRGDKGTTIRISDEAAGQITAVSARLKVPKSTLVNEIMAWVAAQELPAQQLIVGVLDPRYAEDAAQSLAQRSVQLCKEQHDDPT